MTKIDDTKINSTQKMQVKVDLEAALEEFIEREKKSSGVSDQAPFVTVNARTNLLAVHSRLLVALQVSIASSVKKHIGSETGAFDKASFKASNTKVKCLIPAGGGGNQGVRRRDGRLQWFCQGASARREVQQPEEQEHDQLGSFCHQTETNDPS